MHPLIASAGHTAIPSHISHVAAAVTALIVAAVIVVLFKVLGRIFSPRKAKSRTASPYAVTAKRR